MLKVMQMVLGMMVVVVMVTGCQKMTGTTAGRTIDDSTITASVKSKLANHQMSSLTRVGVKTVGGEVHLTGIVRSLEEKKEAARVARQVEAVKRVDNDLKVLTE
jgi:hyperosmotically inducible periplasmic protein